MERLQEQVHPPDMDVDDVPDDPEPDTADFVVSLLCRDEWGGDPAAWPDAVRRAGPLPELLSDAAPKWFAGVLAELRAHPPTAAALHALLCDELPQQRPRLAQDVPAYCSFLIKALRKAASAGATTCAAASAAATSAAAAAAATPTDEGPDATVPLKRVRTQSLCPDDAVPSRQRQGEKEREV